MALLFEEVVDDLVAVLAIASVGYVDPVCAFGVVLPDELVEVEVLKDIVEELAATSEVAFDADVSGFALQVLGVRHSAYGFVERWAAEA